MGGTSLKRVFFPKKKKKSPLRDAFNQLQRALPKKKTKKKSILKKLQLDNLKKDKKSKKRFSLTREKKASKSLKVFSLSKEKKESDPNNSEGKKEKDREVLSRMGDKIKWKFSQENKSELNVEPEMTPLKEANEGKTSLQKLKDMMKPRNTETKKTEDT